MLAIEKKDCASACAGLCLMLIRAEVKKIQALRPLTVLYARVSMWRATRLNNGYTEIGKDRAGETAHMREQIR